MVKKMCVIDATDCIGYVTSQRLSLTGFQIVAISADEKKISKLSPHENIERRLIPDYKKEYLVPALKDVQVCCVNRAGWKPQMDFVKTLIDSARDAGVLHVVYVTSAGSESDTLKPFGPELGEAEYMVANANIGWTIVRYNFLMQYLLLCISHNPDTFCFPSGDATVSFVDARDVAIAVSEIMASGFHFHGRIFTLTGPSSYTFKQCADILSKVTGVTIESGQCNPDILKSIVSARGVDERLLQYITKWSALAKAGGAVNVFDNVVSVAGVEPITFEDFVRDNANQIRILLSEGTLPEELHYII
ncbi:MAG: NAD(P)H-binding protein [Chitinispirillaceae bacterium]|nr:NAD(P)H-binding protein [Chitinispirillaceae bacterium]